MKQIKFFLTSILFMLTQSTFGHLIRTMLKSLTKAISITIPVVLVVALNTPCAQAQFPPIRVQGDYLVVNDGTNARWFFAGMVDNSPNDGMQLTRYNSTEMEQMLIQYKNMKATGVRWNAFLKGLDLDWDINYYVKGFYPVGDPLAALKDGLDLAQKHGLYVQIVLTTTHFLNYGKQGPDAIIEGRISNKQRVANNKKMFSTDKGIQAYIDNIIVPMANTLGQHPALAGYLIINEAYGMTDPQDSKRGHWTDEFARLEDLQRFVNRVASKLKELQPGVLCSVSGLPETKLQYEDAALVAAGGKDNGVMDLWQYNYYHNHHKGTDSPFNYSPQEMVNMFGGSNKPAICGEFWLEGAEDGWNLQQSYEALWNNGYSGGWSWQFLFFEDQTLDRSANQSEVINTYQTFYEDFLSKPTIVQPGDDVTSYYQNLPADNQILLYPNPTKSEVSIPLNNNVENVKIKVLSVDGKVMFSQNIRNTERINLNLSGYPMGVYTIIMNLNDKIIQKYIVVQ